MSEANRIIACDSRHSLHERIMSPLLIVHVAAGSLALISGAATLSVRKGEHLHRAFGTVFVLTMLVMAVTGALLAALQPHGGTVIVGVLTCYFVATAWVAARRKRGPGLFEKVALLVPVGAAAALGVLAWKAANSRTGTFGDLPPEPYLAIAAFTAFVAVLDLNLVLRGRASGPQRIARHLWRMCFALSFAAATFFLGQQQVFPASLHGSPILFAPVLAPLALLVFWLLRVRFTNWWRDDADAPG